VHYGVDCRDEMSGESVRPNRLWIFDRRVQVKELTKLLQPAQ